MDNHDQRRIIGISRTVGVGCFALYATVQRTLMVVYLEQYKIMYINSYKQPRTGNLGPVVRTLDTVLKILQVYNY